MRNSKGFWIWGGFKSDETKYLNSLKKKVNSTLISPSFDVHLTISGPYNNINLKFENSIKYFCSNNFPIKIYTSGLKYKNEEYKSFYISIVNTFEIEKLRTSLFEIEEFPIDKHFEPHISLAYGNHDLILKKELIKNLPIFRSSLNLTNLSLVNVDESKDKWDIIKNYEFKKL